MVLERLVGAAVLSTAICAAPATAQAPAPFTEEAQARGIDYAVTQALDETGFGAGLALVDLDGDGDPDLVTLGASDGHVGVYENDGTGSFADRSSVSGIPPVAHSSGVSAADYDADGDLDLYLSLWLQPNLLLRNDGGFQFADVSASSGIDDPGAGTGCAWGDINGDGWLDLYLANRTQSDGSEIPNRMFVNQGDGQFQDLARYLGVDAKIEMSFQGILLDHDRDGDPDLFLSNDKGSNGFWTNRLWRNDGGLFSEVTTPSGFDAGINSMGVGVGDFDGNGYPDLYCTNTHEGNVLHLSQGDGTFLDHAVGTALAGVACNSVGWGAHVFDFDNDRHGELYVCNMSDPNRLYDHDGVWPARDEAPALGIDDDGASFCLAAADVDGDGDVDLALQNWNEPIRLYVNQEGQQRSWIRFDVVGTGRNLHAIGASLGTLSDGHRSTGDVQSGSNYKSQNELTLHFGLAHRDRIDRVDVLWPDGETRVLTDYPARATWRVYPDELLGDADGDGDVDGADTMSFWSCYTGPSPGVLAPGCEVMDLDGDGDVDSDDWLALRQRMTALQAPGGSVGSQGSEGDG